MGRGKSIRALYLILKCNYICNRSFGVVYKAMHLDSLHEIAVKIIEVDLAQTVDLQNEIAILKV